MGGFRGLPATSLAQKTDLGIDLMAVAEPVHETTARTLKDLAEGFSTHCRAANRLWTALMGSALFVLARLPAAAPGPYPTVELPWSLGTVQTAHFYFVAALILSVLLTAFCSAHAQMARAYVLAMQMGRELLRPGPGQPDPRDVLEAIIGSSFLRVAPLARLWSGRYGFARSSRRSSLRAALVTSHYVLLKALAIVVYLLFPGLAVVATWLSYENNGLGDVGVPLLAWIVRFAVLFSLLGLGLTLFSEVHHVIVASSDMYRGDKE